MAFPGARGGTNLRMDFCGLVKLLLNLQTQTFIVCLNDLTINFARLRCPVCPGPCPEAVSIFYQMQKGKTFWTRLRRVFSSQLVVRPLVAACIAMGLMYFLASDVNSDMLMGTLCGSSDIEVSDFYNRVRAGGSQKTLHDDIVVVNIDSVIDRGDLAMLLTQVSDAQPRAVCLDVLFEGDKDPESDEELAIALMSTPNLTVSQRYSDADYAPTPDFTSEYSPETPRGMANLTSNRPHGLIREVTPFFGQKKQYPCLAAAMLKDLDPGAYKRLQERGEEDEMIRFQPEEFYVADPQEVWDDPSMLKDKIVFLGTIEEQGDLHQTPLSEDYPGVLIQANILSMMMRQDYVNQRSGTWNLLLELLSCLLMAVLYVYLDSAQNFVMRVLPIVWMGVVAFLGCWAFDHYGIYLNAPHTMLLAALSLLVLDTWYAFEGPVKKLWRRLFGKKDAPLSEVMEAAPVLEENIDKPNNTQDKQ